MFKLIHRLINVLKLRIDWLGVSTDRIFTHILYVASPNGQQNILHNILGFSHTYKLYWSVSGVLFCILTRFEAHLESLAHSRS